MNNFYRYTLLNSFILLASSILCFGQQKGVVLGERSSPPGLVSFSASSTLTGISDAKHIDGYVRKYGSAHFVFPVGDNGIYRPFAAEADATTGAYFQQNPGAATLPAGAPFLTSSKESGIKNISTKEYWDINGSVSTRITLTWNPASAIGTLTDESLPNLAIVGWNNTTSRWEAITSAIDEVDLLGGSSTLSKGSITTVEKIIPNTYRVYTLAALTTAPVSVSYKGELESASCSELVGWAWDENHPNAAVTLELLVGSTVHATFVANTFREDLEAAGKGTGKYGFRVNVPSNLLNGQAQAISIRVRSSSYQLSGSPKTLNCSFGGAFEVADCNTISGWIRDENNDATALSFELMEGSVVHATGVANIYRADLKNAGIGTGKYGFSIELPVGLKDSKTHALTIRIKGTTMVLPTVKNLFCSAAQLDGYFYANCSKLYGWAWDKKYQGTPVTIEIYEGSKIHATVVANGFRQDLKDAGMGTGYYGYDIPLPASLKDARQHQLSARVKGSTFILKSGPQTINCLVPSDYAGALESADCSTIKGYAWDKSYPDSAVVVELLDGTKVLATATANLNRADLAASGIGTGKYGFSFTFPTALKDAAAHQLSVRIKGKGVTLSGSPKSVTCAVPSFYEGYGYASCTKLWGWAWDKKYPNAALTVEIYEGSTIYATVVANTYRSDLPFGTGNYGYSITLPQSLKDGRTHKLNARVKGTTFLLTNSPQTITCGLPRAYAGTLETADCNTITGFAWDQNYPDSAMTVELMEGTTILGTAVASTYRADLKNAGTGTGNYGFSFALPAVLRDGAAHALSVRIKGTGIILTGSPKSVTCALPSVYAGGFDFASCATLKGWAWDKNYASRTLTVEIFEGSTIYATVVADIYRSDLKSKGYGTGNYGFEIPLPAALKDGSAHALSVRVKGTTYILPASPRSVTCSLPASYAGTLESADCSVIQGFAWDKNAPSKTMTVELMEGSTILATVIADAYRADLKNAGTGTGNYGFSIPLPAALRDGAAHALSVRIKGTTAILTGSPKSVTCSLPTVYAGGFDFASCATLKGWIWDKNYPNKTLTVEIYEGTTVYATVAADIYRSDLKSKGYGTGNYGFEIPLPVALKDGSAHALSVRVKGTTYVLPASPRSVTCSLPASYAGTLESADCTEIKGFAWDKNAPSKTMTVELLEGTTILATVLADTYRADLKNAGTGTGNYGFSIPLPSALRDGAAHALSVRIKGTSTILTGSPKSVTCALPTVYAGGFDFASCATLKGWIWDKNYPNKTLTVEIYEGTTVYATVAADLYRSDLKDKGYGTGNYGFEIPLPVTLKDAAAHALSVRVKGTTYILPSSPRSVTCSLPASYAGTLESADCSLIKGFAWDKNAPSKTMTVELMEGSTILATVVADTYRADLQNAGTGTGNYGFSIPLPAALKDGAAHALSVRIKGTSTILTGSPKSVTCALPTVYGGGFDYLSCATVKGWAWDKNYPEKTLTLEIVEGTTVFGTVTASTYRDDIKNKGYGTGNYGFNLSTPAALKDGNTHSVSIRVKGSTYVIPGSPRVLTCASSARIAVEEEAEIAPNSEIEDLEVIVAPNPTHGQVVANFYLGKQKPASMSVVNVLGQPVWQKSTIGTGSKQQEMIDLSQQVDGIYLFQLKVGSRIETRRIVLAK